MRRPKADLEHRPDITWLRLLERLAHAWRRSGRERPWQIRHSNFNRQVRHFSATVPANALFRSQECTRRRQALRDELDRNFVARLRAGLKSPWWHRLFRRPRTIDRFRRLYARHGQLADFERQHLVYIRERNLLDTLPADSLFSPKERAERVYRHTRPLRRQFIKHQQQILRKYRSYDQLVETLPTDDIDHKLARLEDDYNYVGRDREWYREFDKLVDDVLEDSHRETQGVNEPRIRLLQNDFLLTMQGRLPVYWRYFQLRNRCFREKITDMINRFSYFEQSLIENHCSEADTTDCHMLVADFTRKTQNILSNEQRRQRNRQRVDHTERLAEWDVLRPRFDDPIKNVIAAFSRLKPVLKSSPDWLHELNVFNATLLVRRDMDGRRKNSPEELDETREFIQHMVARIDKEIATDVAFQTVEQDLMREGRHLDELHTVLRHIGVERRSNSSHSADEITRIKQDFIRSVLKQHSNVRQSASVTPLFAAHRTRSRKPPTPGAGRP